MHLFPELLNLYADRGNIAVLRARAEARGIPVEVAAVKLGQPLDLAEASLVLLGGGSDREQAVVGRELSRYRADLLAAVEAGMPLLAVCGGYQLLGEYYELPDGGRIPGLSLVEMATAAGGRRLIGNIAVTWTDAEGGRGPRTVVGFENHGGRTRHAYPPFGTVLKGCGNNGEDGREGLRYRNVLGTYIHGPLLPKNPHVADWLLGQALAYAGMGRAEDLAALDDELEWRAHRAFLARLGLA